MTKRRKPNRNTRSRSNQCSSEYSCLEPRQLLAGISFRAINGFPTVVIDGSGGADVASVQQLASGNLRATLNTEQSIFSPTRIERILFTGRNGADTFTNLTSVPSFIYGQNGNDVLRGGSGNNWIQGGQGNDSLHGGDRNDSIRGNEGNDFINPGLRNDRVFGGDGADVVAASDGDDLILGEDGNDTLSGGNGFDRILGGLGDDTILGGDSADRIEGGEGRDQIQGQAGNDRLFGDDGNDTVFGGDGLDFLYGGIGTDFLYGQNGNDVIEGNNGADRIFGGAGNDIARGGSGSDRFDLGNSPTDVVEYAGPLASFTVTDNNSSFTVTDNQSNNGVDTVLSARLLRFSDGDRTTESFRFTLSDGEQRSLALINSLRTQNGRGSLTARSDLSQFAEDWSLHMSQTSLHHSTRAEYGHLLTGSRNGWGENIIHTDDTSLSAVEVAELFHETWANSSGHYANMINSSFTEIGIGIYRTANGWYGTHTFSDA